MPAHKFIGLTILRAIKEAWLLPQTIANVVRQRRRSLRKAGLVDSTDIYRIKQNLPFSH